MAFRFNPLTGQLDLVGGSGTPSGTTPATQTFTLDNTDITNKYVTLSMSPATPGDTVLIVSGAAGTFYGVDFTVIGAQVSWSGLSLDGLLSSGDSLTVLYIL